jgi:hypothetical protein
MTIKDAIECLKIDIDCNKIAFDGSSYSNSKFSAMTKIRAEKLAIKALQYCEKMGVSFEDE